VTSHWAREAHRFDPTTGRRRRKPTRRQRRLADKKLAERETWSELDLDHQVSE
jgi:hypothetical protein